VRPPRRPRRAAPRPVRPPPPPAGRPSPRAPPLPRRKARFPASRVVGQTNTDNNHAALAALGLEPRTKAGAPADRFPFVLFAAPPSGSDDYAAEVEAALALWDGTGAFVFTSSAGLYTENACGTVREGSPAAALGDSPRTDKLLLAEQAVLR